MVCSDATQVAVMTNVNVVWHTSEIVGLGGTANVGPVGAVVAPEGQIADLELGAIDPSILLEDVGPGGVGSGRLRMIRPKGVDNGS